MLIQKIYWLTHCFTGSCSHPAGGEEAVKDQRCVKRTTKSSLLVHSYYAHLSVFIEILNIDLLSFRTLEYLMHHLVRMASYSSETNMHARNLAIVWAPNLLRFALIFVVFAVYLCWSDLHGCCLILAHDTEFKHPTFLEFISSLLIFASQWLRMSRSKDIEASGFNGTAVFKEVRVQSIVVEFILTHVPELFPEQGSPC